MFYVSIVIFMAFHSLPVWGDDQRQPVLGMISYSITAYQSKNSGFIDSDRDRNCFLATGLQKFLSRSRMNDFLLRKMVITADFRERSFLSALPWQLMFEKTSGSDLIKGSGVNDRTKITLYTDISKHMRSPVLAPFKYKTASNTLLSMMLPIPVTDHWTIIPIVSYSFFINGSDRSDLKLKSPIRDRGETVFYGGINLSYIF